VSATLEEKANELAMLLVMVDANDKTGLAALEDYVAKIKTEAKKGKKHKRLAAACDYVLKEKASLESAAFLDLLNSFVSTLQNYLQTPERAVFPNEQPKSSSEGNDLGEYFDPEFLVDFIEKHSMMLDELEGKIVDYRFAEDRSNEQKTKDFNSFVKGYLHNIKGDAGSIGLVGIEKTTHDFEEVLLTQPACELLDQLITYKEWVQSCISAYSAGKNPPELSSSFIPRLLQDCSAGAASKQTQSGKTAPSKEDEIKKMLLEQIEQEFGGQSKPAQNEDEDLKAALLAQIEAEFGPAAPKEESSELETYQISADAELISEFVAEAEDHLSHVESILLESTGEFSADDIGTIFRGVHSLKGASSYFNLLEINETSHILENLLDEVRDGKRELDQTLIGLVFTYIDLQKKLLTKTTQAIKTDGKLTRSREVHDYLKSLEAYAKGDAAPSGQQTPQTPSNIPSPSMEESAAELQTTAAAAATVKSDSKLHVKTFIKVDTDRLDSLVDTKG
jgi:chemotaxis protein histidine kinase CheA